MLITTNPYRSPTAQEFSPSNTPSCSNGDVQQTNGHNEGGQQREIGIEVVPEATGHRCEYVGSQGDIRVITSLEYGIPMPFYIFGNTQFPKMICLGVPDWFEMWIFSFVQLRFRLETLTIAFMSMLSYLGGKWTF